MGALVVLVVALPLVASAVTLCLLRHRSVQRALSVTVLAVNVAFAIAALAGVERNGTVVVRLGGWATDVGIALVMDRLAAVMVLIGASMVLVVHVFAIGQGTADGDSAYYEPSYLALAAGVSLAFVAGDLFHLFVAIEVLLMASYVLITLEGTDAQIASGTTYTVLNVIESFVLFLAVGLVYAATGTVNLAELAERVPGLGDGVSHGLNLLLLLAFGLKAAVFPLFFWLPDSYPTAPSPVTAVFAGLLTKIGVYAIIRVEATVFPGEHRILLLVIGALTIVVGALGALAQGDMKRILSFHIVSQIGYMVIGVGIGSAAAIAATIIFVIHQIPVKTALFLVEGTLERTAGTSRLDDIGGMLSRSGTLAVLFGLPALSLAGFPPLSGFVGKLGLVNAAIDDRTWWIVGVAIGGSLLTLVSMAKIWTGVFWGELRPAGVPRGIVRRHGLMSAATVTTVVITLVIAAAAGPIVRFADRAAADLLTRCVSRCRRRDRDGPRPRARVARLQRPSHVGEPDRRTGRGAGRGGGRAPAPHRREPGPAARPRAPGRRPHATARRLDHGRRRRRRVADPRPHAGRDRGGPPHDLVLARRHDRGQRRHRHARHAHARCQLGARDGPLRAGDPRHRPVRPEALRADVLALERTVLRAVVPWGSRR